MNTVYVQFTPPRYIVKVTVGKERLLGFSRDKDATEAELWLPRSEIHSFDYEGQTSGPWIHDRMALRGIFVSKDLAERKNLRYEEILPF